jgi:predicted HicB family RNase H-like nuclease
MKFNLELKDEKHEELKIMAARKKISMNKLIENAVYKMLDDEKKMDSLV